MEAGRCALWRFLSVQSILKHRFVWACICLHAAWGQSIHWPVPALLSPHCLRKWQGSAIPHSHFSALLTSPQPSDMFRCGYHLPVSPSHVVSSEDLVSQTEESLASGAEGDTYSTVEAATATCGAYSKDRLKQLPYWHNIIVLVFEVHRMRRTRWATMTGGNQPGPE